MALVIRRFLLIVAFLSSISAKGQSVGGPRFLYSQSEFDVWSSYHDLLGEKFNKNITTSKLTLSWIPYVAKLTADSLRDSLAGTSPDKTYLLLLSRYPSPKKNLAKNVQSAQSVKHFKIVPLSKVELIKNSNATSATLMIFGDSAYADSFAWLNANLFEIYGFKQIKKGKYIPTVWQYNIGKMTVSESESKTVLKKKPRDYLKWKMKQL